MKNRINFSTDSYSKKIQEEINKQGVNIKVFSTPNNICVVNTKTKKEFSIRNGSEKNVEGLMKFMLENGVKVNRNNIGTFSEILNFAGIPNEKISLGFFGRNDDDDLYYASMYVPEIMEQSKKLAQAIKELSSNPAFKLLGKGCVSDLTTIFRMTKRIYIQLKSICDKQFKSDKFKEIKKQLDALYQATPKTIEITGKKDSITAESLNKKYEELKQALIKEGGSKASPEKINKFKEQKAYLKKLAEKNKISDKINFDSSNSQKETALENLKKQLSIYLYDYEAKLNTLSSGLSEGDFKKRKWKVFAKELNNAIKGLSNYIIDVATKYGSESVKKETFEEEAKKLNKQVEAIRKDIAGELNEESDEDKAKREASEKELLEKVTEAASKVNSAFNADTLNKLGKTKKAILEYKSNPSDETLGKLDESLKKELNGYDKIIDAIKSTVEQSVGSNDPLGLGSKDNEDSTKNDSLGLGPKDDDSKTYDNSKTDDEDKLKAKYREYADALAKKKPGRQPKKYENWKKENNFSEVKSFSDIMNDFLGKRVMFFDAHKVKDSDFGIAYEDKFGSLWSENPDESPDAEMLWESKEGHEDPVKESLADKSLNTEEDENEALGLGDDDNADTEGGNDDLGDLGGDDLDLGEDDDLGGDEDSLDLEEDEGGDLGLDGGEDEGGGEDLDFSEDNLDLDDDLSLDEDEGDDLSLDDEGDDDLSLDEDGTEGNDDLSLDLGEEDESLDSDFGEDNLQQEQDNTTEELVKVQGDNLNHAIDVINQMYNKLLDKVR